MKQLPSFPKQYFNKFSESPISIMSFDRNTIPVAKKYSMKLSKLISNEFPNVEIAHRGSSYLKIVGKNDIDIGLYVPSKHWYALIIYLANIYQGIGNLDKDYARFNDTLNGYAVEIILMRNYTALLDQTMHRYLINHPQILRSYERLKRKYAYSEREYMRQKDLFFRKIIARIPE